MRCPNCKQEIEHVNVYSQCLQFAELKGKRIANFGVVEEILETLGIECPECQADITKEVTE